MDSVTNTLITRPIITDNQRMTEMATKKGKIFKAFKQLSIGYIFTLDDVSHTYTWCGHPYIISL